MASRKIKPRDPAGALEVTQDAPTAPPNRDASGRLLDAWNVPVNGPDRVAYLADMDMPDPHDDPDAWLIAPPALDKPDLEYVPDVVDQGVKEEELNNG
jgi:hypothetical protein